MNLVRAITLALFFFTPTSVTARPLSHERHEDGSLRALYLSLIQQARADGRVRAALAYLDDFDRQHTGDLESRILRVNCLLDIGDIAQAEAAVARIPAADKSSAVLSVRGHLFAAQERWGDAIVSYTGAQAGNPSDPYIGNALGYVQLRAGYAEQAVETLRRAFDLSNRSEKGSAVVRNNLILALTAGGHAEDAELLLKRISSATERAEVRARVFAEVKNAQVARHKADVQ